jgi:serine/threonine protein kinase
MDPRSTGGPVSTSASTSPVPPFSGNRQQSLLLSGFQNSQCITVNTNAYSSPFISNYDFLKDEDPDFQLTDSTVWGPDTNTPTDELAPKPKTGKSDDPCGCVRPKWEDQQTKPREELMQCGDLSCVLFACLEECRSNCEAGDFCGNKRIQRKQWKKLEVFQTGKKGKGLRVLEDVKKGDLVTEYVGKAVNKLYLNRLFRRYANERKLYIMAITNDIYLDARKMGGVARYINHSCDPNCQVERWKVRGIMRAAVVAYRDIPAGTELSFDYQWERKRGRAPTKCYCGAKTCRQTLEVSRSMEEEEIERRLSQHWKKPMISRAGKEIVNRCIKLLSKEAQDYYPADVVQYDEKTGKHLLMYRHDLDEVWEDLKTEDWMILDEEAEQFIIRKKSTSNITSAISNGTNTTGTSFNRSLIGGNAHSGLLLQGQQGASVNYVYTQTHVKEALFDRHLIERCQRSCRVTITPQQLSKDSIQSNNEHSEYEQQMKALRDNQDGIIWKMTIAGSDVAKARQILAKNIAYIVSKSTEGNAGSGPKNSAMNGAMKTPTATKTPAKTSSADLNSSEFVFPRVLVDSIKRRLPNLRERCRNVNITFVPSESKSKQFAKLIVEGALVTDVEIGKEHLWKQLNLACEELNTPKTRTGVFKDLGILGGQMSSSDFNKLLAFDTAGLESVPSQYGGKAAVVGNGVGGNASLSLRQDAKEDLSRWSPFFASFEESQRCTIWVQAESDMGRINKENRLVSIATPNAPRKLYFGCEPKVVQKFWKQVESRAMEVGRGVKYLYLGPDRIYMPQMLQNNGQFFEFINEASSAAVTIDTVTGDHLRIDGEDKGQAIDLSNDTTVGERVALAEELIRLQIELYRDHCIRQDNWIYGRDWAFALRSAKKKSSNEGDENPSTGTTGRGAFGKNNPIFDPKTVANACLDISDIIKSLELDGNVAAHASIIMYRFITVLSQQTYMETQLKIREILLACVFIANKAQKASKWKKLDLVLSAAYKSFYPGVKFDSSKEESLVWEEKLIAAELEILEQLNYDVFCGGFGWIVAAAVESGAMDQRLANITLAFAISGPVLAAGQDLWLTYGEEYIFTACAAFLDAKFENLFAALSLIPIKVLQTAEMIASSLNKTGLGKKHLANHPILKEGKKGLQDRLPAIKTLCAFLMSNKQGLGGQVSIRPSETELRYKIIRDRNKERRTFQNVPTPVIKDYILPSIDGISAESKCNIFINRNQLSMSYAIILEGSWRAISIASFLLKEATKNVLGESIEQRGNKHEEQSNIQAKGQPGMLKMNMIQDSWSGTIQSEVSNQAFWGRKTGGKCCVPGKVKSSDLRQRGLRWWIPPRYGPSTTGSICDMFLNNKDDKIIDALRNLCFGSQGKSPAFSMLSSSTGNDSSNADRFVAVSLHRWPSEKVAAREQARAKRDAKKGKKSKKTVNQVGFSPAALQEMQTLRQLHGLINSPQGHPNLYLPIGVALPSEQQKRDNNSLPDSFESSFDLKRIDEDIFSLTRTSLENEVAAKKEKERKEMVNDRHLVIQPTPFILQRFVQKKRRDDKEDQQKILSPTIFASWCFDLLSAVLHCHENRIVLRGTLNLDLIVIDHSGVAKIGSLYKTSMLSKGDLKLSKNSGLLKQAREKKKELDRRKKENPKYVSDEQDDILKDPYVPPELLLGSPKYTRETDIWALGCLLSNLLLNKPLYSGKDKSSRESLLSAMYKLVGIPSKDNFEIGAKFPYYKKPEKKYRPGVEKAIPKLMKDGGENSAYEGAIDLIRQMLHLDPEQRISAKQALQHEYMSTYIENCNTQAFQESFVKDWISLKKRLTKSCEDESKERERGIKRKAMLMAASSRSAATTDNDDLYDMGDIFGVGETKKPKV